VERIMEEHGGALLLTDAATPPGAHVTLRLPLAPSLAASATARPTSAVPASALKDA
jgi:hypothetical protein